MWTKEEQKIVDKLENEIIQRINESYERHWLHGYEPKLTGLFPLIDVKH